MKRLVLITEDEGALAKVLKVTLEKYGFDSLIAKDGVECIDIALKKHPDIILLDVIMPHLDGLSALEEIRKDEWGKTVPIIILTNINDNNEPVLARIGEDKLVTYMVKSDWSMDEIIKKIEEILKIDTSSSQDSELKAA